MRQRIGFCSASDGVRIAYATAGHGEPLLRVGGWLTHVEYDWDSPVWEPWLRELTRDRTLARFDIRGSGLSDHDVDDQGVEAWVRDLEAVVDDLGWQRFPLLGICQGGAIAVAYAARHPERVSRLVLYNPYAQGAYTEGIPEAKAREARALAGMIEVGWGRHRGTFREVFARLFSPREAGEQIAWWEDLQRRTATPEDAARLWQAFNDLDIRESLANVTHPTLVMHVKHDAVVPFEAGREVATRIPHADFLPLDGGNHVLQPSDSGWPVFVRELRRFLAEDGTAPLPTRFDLTRRERAVLDLVARGQRNDEIAEQLAIRAKTVRNHVSNIAGKLGTTSRARLIVEAREAGFGTD
ncbi:alpha/beta fold hydrolase [Halofilum ochraceum]|uniref:alpha/beta fold hydrolase n=1 Tax=Halofilum ochraceum TaxID=1611323 RepID=UPI000946B5D5|nr:alpha/beta fold hydrolase [Halofilum ochraceum]